MIATEDQTLGSIVIGGRPADAEHPPGEHAGSLRPWPAAQQESAVRLGKFLAGVIAKLAVQAYQLQHRSGELDTVHAITNMLSGTQDLQGVLDLIARQVCEVMHVKACSIRLLQEQSQELVIKAVHNLSKEYLDKGRILVADNPIDRAALAGETVYVEDATSDARVRFPKQAAKEGIVSGLSVGMTYRGQTIGVMRVYTGKCWTFSDAEAALLRSIASQAAAAIINSRLYLEALEADRYERQLSYAGEIQRRMIPASVPQHPKMELAFVYEPSSDVGGDFFDFYPFDDSGELGVCIADVVGKGIPAALMMASLRTAFRLYVHSVIEITEIMTMTNIHMCRETLASEFATIFYGVFSANGRKLTYCNAGHDPPLLWRGGKLEQLGGTNLVVGVSINESFKKKSVALKKDDALLLYTDGLIDAANFSGEAFGRERLFESFQRHAGCSASALAHNVIWDIRRFVGLASQADDITLVAVKIQ